MARTPATAGFATAAEEVKMSKSVWVATTAAVLFVFASGVHAQKIKREPITPIRDVAGAATYKAYCAQCHGTEGRGNGPVAKALNVAPADLTRIAERRGGHFRTVDVKQIILGDQEMLPHGTREMPLWGPAFRSVEDSAVAELRLANLVRYLETLQQK
jgi:mono/diheme cytochrome c family protein